MNISELPSSIRRKAKRAGLPVASFLAAGAIACSPSSSDPEVISINYPPCSVDPQTRTENIIIGIGLDETRVVTINNTSIRAVHEKGENFDVVNTKDDVVRDGGNENHVKITSMTEGRVYDIRVDSVNPLSSGINLFDYDLRLQSIASCLPQ